MSNEVYSIGIDLSKLKEALKISTNIKSNIGADSKKKKTMLGDLSASNKQLKEQNKQLSITEQKLKLIRLTSSKIKLGALALGGLAVGGVIGSLANMKGSLSADLQARNLGLKFGESKALGYADKMVGLNEGTLMNSISGLNKALDDFSQWGNFASLGLNASELKKKNPTEALFDVLDAMKTSDLPKYMKRNIIDQIGIPFDDFQFVLEEGTGELRKFFKQGMGLFGKQGAGVLKSSERALINFQNVLKSLSLSTANKLLPAFTKALNVATPLILKMSDAFAKLLNKVFTKENIQYIENTFKFLKVLSKKIIDSSKIIFNDLSNLFKNMFSGISFDKSGWIDVFKEFGNSLVDGFKQLWSTLSPNLVSIGQSLVDLWNTIEPDLIKAISFWNKNILPPLKSISSSLINILGKVIKKVIVDFQAFYTLIRPVLKPLGKAITLFYNAVANVLKKFDNFLSSEAGSGLVDFISGVVSPISALIKTIELATNAFNSLRNSIKSVATNIKNGFTNTITSIKESFLIMITGLIDMLNGILKNKAVSVLTGGATIKAGWGYDEQGNFSKRTYDSRGNYSYTKVNDGVITKDGQVIKTNPQDYIFAMKQPQQLATAGAGNYNITINANVRNDNDIIKIKNELNRLITQLNAKR